MRPGLIDVPDSTEQDLRRAGQRVGLDHRGVEALDPHRRAVPFGAVPRDQAGDPRACRGSDCQWIRVVDVQDLQFRALLPDAGEQPSDRTDITSQVGKETGLLAEPEVPHPGLVQCRHFGQHVSRIAEVDKRALYRLIAERAEPPPGAAPVQLDLGDRPPAKLTDQPRVRATICGHPLIASGAPAAERHVPGGDGVGMHGVEPAGEHPRLGQHLRSQRAEQYPSAPRPRQDLIDFLRRAVVCLKVHRRDSVPGNHDDYFRVRENPQRILAARRSRVGQRIG